MQYDMERFEQPLVDESQPKAHVWTDIGEAEVEHSVFGKAKVRVYRKNDEIRGAVRWTILTILLVAGVVWLLNDISRQPEIVYVAPPEPVVEVATSVQKKQVPVVPPIKPRVLPPIANSMPVPPLQASSAPVAAKTMLRAPVTVSGTSAPVAAQPVVVKPVTTTAPVAVAPKPLAPAAPVAAVVPVVAKPVVPPVPAAASSAVSVSN
jgi:hypothetical protein